MMLAPGPPPPVALALHHSPESPFMPSTPARPAAAVAALALLATALSAQDFIGFTYNVSVSAASRGGVPSNAAGESMVRIDGCEYGCWGTDVAGQRTVRSVVFIIQDQNGSTPETFDILLYPENAAQPGFPDLSAGVTLAAGLAGPTGGPGPAAVLRTVTPTVPPSVPIVTGGGACGSVFLSFRLPASPSGTATDGLSLQIMFGTNVGLGGFDLPGPRQQPAAPPGAANSHALFFQAPSTLAYVSRREPFF